MTTRRILFLIAFGWVMAALSVAPARADSLPSNCEVRPWGFLGLTQIRGICDDPIQADGSWMRHRMIGTPAHYRPATTSCSGGYYLSTCYTYPGGWVDEQIADDETYPVRPETVLPDEPGHLGVGPAPAAPTPSTIA